MILRTVEEHLSEFRLEDLVVIKGGSNSLEETGRKETIKMERIVRLVKRRVNRSSLVMCIPMRQDKEGRRSGQERRWVNTE